VLRQQTQPGDIIQSQIINGGLKPNIIHAYASGQFVVRSATKDRLDALRARVLHCLNAGAVATGARLEITSSRYSYQDHVPSRALGNSYRRHFVALGGRIPHDYTAVTQASTDQGNISHALPSLHTNFWIESEDGGPHTADFEKAARSDDAYVAVCLCNKADKADKVVVVMIVP
jgi:metal-dependent amidase/aminoacylase/carboxypeptidase family protein